MQCDHWYVINAILWKQYKCKYNNNTINSYRSWAQSCDFFIFAYFRRKYLLNKRGSQRQKYFLRLSLYGIMWAKRDGIFSLRSGHFDIWFLKLQQIEFCLLYSCVSKWGWYWIYIGNVICQAHPQLQLCWDE